MLSWTYFLFRSAILKFFRVIDSGIFRDSLTLWWWHKPVDLLFCCCFVHTGDDSSQSVLLRRSTFTLYFRKYSMNPSQTTSGAGYIHFFNPLIPPSIMFSWIDYIAELSDCFEGRKTYNKGTICKMLSCIPGSSNTDLFGLATETLSRFLMYILLCILPPIIFTTGCYKGCLFVNSNSSWKDGRVIYQHM